MTHRPLAAALLALLLAGCDARSEPPASGPAASPQHLPTVTVNANGTPLTLQVADDQAERETGLMYVKSMPADAGMLFVFPVEQTLTFWMKNTAIDLDIVYLDHAGTVVAAKTMHAYDLSNVSSDEPATYAIELNAGAAAKLNVKVGQTVELPKGIADHAK